MMSVTPNKILSRRIKTGLDPEAFFKRGAVRSSSCPSLQFQTSHGSSSCVSSAVACLSYYRRAKHQAQLPCSVGDVTAPGAHLLSFASLLRTEAPLPNCKCPVAAPCRLGRSTESRAKPTRSPYGVAKQ